MTGIETWLSLFIVLLFFSIIWGLAFGGEEDAKGKSNLVSGGDTTVTKKKTTSESEAKSTPDEPNTPDIPKLTDKNDPGLGSATSESSKHDSDQDPGPNTIDPGQEKFDR